MKQFRIFVTKEVYHIIRDRRSLIILLGMPVVLVTLFGFAITNEINEARIAVFDPARDEMSRELTDKLLASGHFELTDYLESASQIESNFRKGKTKMVIAFPPHFQRRYLRREPVAIQLIADASDPNAATTLINYATAIIGDYQRERYAAGSPPPLRIQPEVKMLYNPMLEGVYMFVPGVMTVILMLVSAMMTSIAIVREKEQGTMEVLLVSPLPPPLIVIGKVVPYILLSLINTAVILALGTFVFRMPVEGSWGLLGAECLLFVLTSLALGILISTRTNSQQVAMMISLIALMLPTIILSGFIFPIESMPRVLQVVSHIVPAKWFIIILKNIMLKGVGLPFIWKETAILAGMTLLFIGASIRNFKIRLS